MKLRIRTRFLAQSLSRRRKRSVENELAVFELLARTRERPRMERVGRLFCGKSDHNLLAYSK